MQPWTWDPKSKEKEKEQKSNGKCNLGPGAHKAKKDKRQVQEMENAT